MFGYMFGLKYCLTSVCSFYIGFRYLAIVNSDYRVASLSDSHNGGMLTLLSRHFAQ